MVQQLDNNIILSIFSILISVIFAITGFWFSNKSSSALKSIEEKIKALNTNVLPMFDKSLENHMNVTAELLKLIQPSNDKDRSNINKQIQNKVDKYLTYLNEKSSFPSVKTNKPKIK